MKGLASLTPLGYNCPSRRWYSLANLCYCQPTCCLDDTVSEIAIQMKAGVKAKEDEPAQIANSPRAPNLAKVNQVANVSNQHFS